MDIHIHLLFINGSYKDSGKQINPHMKNNDCIKLIKNDKINGCGGQFKVELKDRVFNAFIFSEE
jgi:hypothetical protein